MLNEATWTVRQTAEWMDRTYGPGEYTMSMRYLCSIAGPVSEEFLLDVIRELAIECHSIRPVTFHLLEEGSRKGLYFFRFVASSTSLRTKEVADHTQGMANIQLLPNIDLLVPGYDLAKRSLTVKVQLAADELISFVGIRNYGTQFLDSVVAKIPNCTKYELYTNPDTVTFILETKYENRQQRAIPCPT